MASADNDSTEPSYIDYEAFLSPDFSPSTFANSLVLATNNPSDTPIDLSTPLSRVLFDIQEIDTHIHTLTTKNAIPLLEHTKSQTAAGEKIVKDVQAQVASLTDGYQRLEKEVIERYDAANEVRRTVERLWETVRIGRGVSRCLLLCRQLEAQMSEVSTSTSTSPSTPASKQPQKEDHTALPRAASTLSAIHTLLDVKAPGQEGEALLSITLITTLHSTLIVPADTALRARAQTIIREFSMSSLSSSTTTTTYAQTEDTKARTISACTTLQTLSPQLLLTALQGYLRSQISSSVASLARALGSLQILERVLVEVAARCQNVGALGGVLSGISLSPSSASTPPSTSSTQTLLTALLSALDTSSLPSYFWRSVAEGLAPRVQELVSKGGVPARTLKAQRERVREGIRGCVLRGSQGVQGDAGRARGEWEREAAVMVGSVVGVLGR